MIAWIIVICVVICLIIVYEFGKKPYKRMQEKKEEKIAQLKFQKKSETLKNTYTNNEVVKKWGSEISQFISSDYIKDKDFHYEIQVTDSILFFGSTLQYIYDNEIRYNSNRVIKNCYLLKDAKLYLGAIEYPRPHRIFAEVLCDLIEKSLAEKGIIVNTRRIPAAIEPSDEPVDLQICSNYVLEYTASKQQ